jgi:homoserine dehydrogenase
MVLSIFYTHLKSIHLLGVGKVGCAFLSLLDQNKYKVTGVSDSKYTIKNPCGLDIAELLKTKEQDKQALSSYKLSNEISENNSYLRNTSEFCIDTSPTNLKRSEESFKRSQKILQQGSCLILAAKDSLFYGIDELLNEYPTQIGINAALGGTGRNLIQHLQTLRNYCFAISVVGNATTTSIIEDIEKGSTLWEGIENAGRNGLLESDPTFDLDGSDALIKISIVAKAVFGFKYQLNKIERQHIQNIDPELIRYRKKIGKTTRLIGKANLDGSLKISYDEVDLNSPLCTTHFSVAYQYHLNNNSNLIFTGNGIGPIGTAKSIIEDLTSHSLKRETKND